MIDTKILYEKRFSSYERIRKERLWKILCEDFLQQYIRANDTVVDVGAGHCEFINNIVCGKKIGIDVNADVQSFAHRDVDIHISPVSQIHRLFGTSSLDVLFMSNLLEHLDSKEDVFRLLLHGYELLRPGGRLLIMQPDITLVGHSYWDFFDHKVPITFSSLTEVLRAIGFRIQDARYPFLPYSTKVPFLPLVPLFLKLYLRIRIFQILFGKQFFLCAVKH